jgi:hypothetical protein
VAPGPDGPGVAPPPVEVPKQPKPPETPEPTEPTEPLPAMDFIQFYGLGKVMVTEPGKPATELAGGWRVELGSQFATGTSLAGLLLEGDIQLRLGKATRATVAVGGKPRDLALDTGQLYVVSVYDQSQPVVVTTPLGLVDIVNGRAMVDHRQSRLQVLCLAGSVTMHPRSGASTPVPAGMITWIDREGSGEPPTKAEFIAQYTSWMTGLIVRQEDRSEFEQRVHDMVGEYFGARFHREAARELRRLGAWAVGPLAQALLEHPERPALFQRDTARLVCAMASTDAAPQLFQLLHSSDPEVRVIVYERLVQLTDDGHDYGDRFWRQTDNVEARRQAILQWWERSK